LGQTVADLARNEALHRETLGGGIIARTLDRMNGLETTGPPSLAQSLFGGMVAGNFLDTINAGTLGPRDAIVQSFDMQRGMLNVYAGRGALIDNIA
jgi:hypothetical protein